MRILEKRSKRFRYYLVVILFFLVGQVATAQYTLHTPYPIIFIHGLNSDYKTWSNGNVYKGNDPTNIKDYKTVFDYLVGEDNLLKYGGNLNVTLDYKRDTATLSNKVDEDVHLFTTNPNLGDFYTINFAVNANEEMPLQTNVYLIYPFITSETQTEINVQQTSIFFIGDIICIGNEYMLVEGIGESALKVKRGVCKTKASVHEKSEVIWDLSNESNQASIVKQGAGLKMAIDAIKSVTHADKVILVGHSMGGLAAREYIRQFGGDDVAKLVTIGTPHLGSTAAEISNDVNIIKGIDPRSDAIRDLSYNYAGLSENPMPPYGNLPDNGTYLFGGKKENELETLNKFYNPDVNANGTIDNYQISGLNTDYMDLSLPKSVDYTWIISQWTSIVDGDGCVRYKRQIPWNETDYLSGIPRIGNIITTNKFHTSEPTDYFSLLRGLDEPNIADLAYEIGANSYNKGFITLGTVVNLPPSDPNSTPSILDNIAVTGFDTDFYKINLKDDGLITITILASNHTGITEINLLNDDKKVVKSMYSTSDKIEFQTTTGIYYVQVNGTATGDSYGYPYTLQTSFAKASDIKTAVISYNIGETTAVCGGNIISNGGATITASGLVYSKTPAPTLATGTVVSTSPVVEAGTYSLTMNGLEPDAKYYVRAYATNSIGTCYGEEISFTATSISMSSYTLTDADVVVTEGVIQSCSYDFIKKIITIPETLDGQTVVGIVDNYPGVFEGKGIVKINLPNTLKTIGSFYDNKLTSLTLPNSITTIENAAFSKNQLSSLTISNSVTSIGNAAFSSNQLTNVTIPTCVTSIGIGAFSGNTELASITLPVAVSAGTTFLNWKDNYGTTYAGGAVVTRFELSYTAQFDNTPQPTQYILTDDDVVVTNGIIVSCSYNFAIKDIVIPETLDGQKVIGIEDKDWGFGIFQGKELVKITLPTTIKTIGSHTFDNNGGLISLTLPTPIVDGGLTFINWLDSNGKTYAGGANVTSFTQAYYAQIEYILTDADVVVTDGVMKSCSYNSSANSIVIPETLDGQTVVGIKGASATLFQNKGLVNITLPNTLKTIGAYVFGGNRLISVTIPNSVTRIGYFAFGDNRHLTSITLPTPVVGDGLKFINWIDREEKTYSGGSKVSNFTLSLNAQIEYTLTDADVDVNDGVIQSCNYNLSASCITIPEKLDGQTVVGIKGGQILFWNKGIVKITLPNTLKTIGCFAFGENELTSIIIPNSVTTIDPSAFENNQLSSVTIPNSVTTIGDYAFFGNRLNRVTIPNSVTLIGRSAFTYNFGSLSITLPASVSTGKIFLNWKDNNGNIYASGTALGDYSLSYTAQFCNTITGTVIGANSVTVVMSGDTSASQVVSISETYSFTVNCGQNVVVTATKPGYSFVPVNYKFTNITENKTGSNFVASINTYTITGTVTGADGVTVAISGDVTDSKTVNDGETYSFTVNYGQNVVLTASKALYSFAPVSYSFTNVTTNISGNYFVASYIETPYTLTDADVVVADGIIKSCSYDFSIKNIIIPEVLDGQTIVDIDDDIWCSGVFQNKGIRNIKLPNTLINISERTFQGNQLTNVVIPNGVKAIDWGAFSSNQLTSVTIPNSVTTIGYEAFCNNHLTSVSLPNSVTTIAAFAFSSNSGLASIILPEADLHGIKSDNWKNGNGIIVANNTTVTDFSSSYIAQFVVPTYTITGTVTGTDGVTVALSGEVSDSKTVNNGETYSFTVNYGQSVVVTASKPGYSFVPGSYTLSNVTENKTANNFVASINPYTITGTVTGADGVTVALSGDVTDSKTVNNGETYSFNVNYGQSVVVTASKSGYSFAPGNYTLTNVTENKAANNFVASINTYSITGTVTGADGVTVALSGDVTGSKTVNDGETYSFTVNNGQSVVVTASKDGYFFAPVSYTLANITENKAANNFAASEETSYTLTDADVEVIGGIIKNCSYDFSIKNIIIPETLDGQTILGIEGVNWTSGVFQNKGIREIKLPNTLISIGARTLSGNQLTSVTIPNSVTTIGWGAFANNKLNNITIPNGVTAIEPESFFNNLLTSVSLPNSITSIAFDAFSNNSGLLSITLPEADLHGIKSDGWKSGNGLFIANNTVVTDFSCNYKALFLCKISGTVTGIDGVTLALSGDVTDSKTVNNGETYSFNVNYGQSVVVTASKPGYSFAPGNYTLTNVTENKTANNFSTTYTVTGSLTGTDGVTVALSGDVTDSKTVNNGGTYSFNVNYGQSVVVTASKPGYSFAPGSYTLTNVTGNKTTNNFVASLNPYTITGTVTGIDGVTVALSGDVTNSKTVNNGETYSFNVNYGQSVVVTASKPGYSFVPGSYTLTNVTGNKTTNNFVASLNPYTITGTVTGIDGVTVAISGDVTDSKTVNNGETYSFTVNYGQSVVVTASKPGYSFVPGSYTLANVTGNKTTNNFVASVNPFTIAGTISGADGVTVALSGDVTDSKTVNNGGTYSFNVNYGQSVVVTASKPGYSFVPGSYTLANVTGNKTANNFVASLNPYTITGTVTGIDGVTVAISGDVTDSKTVNNGETYSFTVNYGQSVAVTASKPGYSFAPGSYTFTNVSENKTANNFSTTYTVTGSLTGTDGVNVALSGDVTGSKTVNNGGTYSFNVNYGQSMVVTASKPGYTFAPGSYTLTNVTENKTANNFVASLNHYTITYIVDYVQQSTATVEHGAKATVPVLTKAGYHIDGWYQLIVGLGQIKYDFNTPVTSNLTLRARWVVNTYTITGTVTGTDVVTVALSGDVTDSKTVNNGETYSFNVNYGQSVVVTASKPGCSFVPGSYTFTNVTDSKTGNNFVASINPYTITGTVTGADGVTVTLSGDVTDSKTVNNGETYSFNVNYAQSVVVTASKPGCSFVPGSYTLTNVTENKTANNFVASINPYTITGTVTGADGVTVTLSGDVTDSKTVNNGETYSFNVNYGQSMVVTASKPGYSFVPSSYTLTNVTENKTANNFVASLNPYTIAGTISGADGVTVALSGDVTDSKTVNNGETYSFNVNYGQSVFVTASKPGYTFAPGSYTLTNVTENKTANNFVASINPYTIAGTVTGADGVTVALSGDVTDSKTVNNGETYSFNVNYGQSVVVTASKPGCSFVPGSYTLANVTGNKTANNFVASINPYTIAGTISGADGVTVALSGDVTDSKTVNNGETYSFNVNYGQSVVVTASKPGYSFVPGSYALANVTGNKTTNNFVASVTTSVDNCFETNISCYPNPVKSTLIIKLPANDEIVSVQICSITGDILYWVKDTTSKNFFIDVNGYPSGVLLVRITNNKKGVVIIKIIKLVN